MVAHFSYDKPKQVVFQELRSHLENSGFIIKEYAPEDAFLFTDFKLYDWGTGRRLLAVAVHVNDKMLYRVHLKVVMASKLEFLD